MRRFVSWWLRSWRTDRLTRQWPLPAETPTVTVEEIGGRALIVAPNGVAAAGGILPGLSLADARALLPGIAVFPADPADDAAALARLADWCNRYTPLVAGDGGGGLLLHIPRFAPPLPRRTRRSAHLSHR